MKEHIRIFILLLCALCVCVNTADAQDRSLQTSIYENPPLIVSEGEDGERCLTIIEPDGTVNEIRIDGTSLAIHQTSNLGSSQRILPLLDMPTAEKIVYIPGFLVVYQKNTQTQRIMRISLTDASNEIWEVDK